MSRQFQNSKDYDLEIQGVSRQFQKSEDYGLEIQGVSSQFQKSKDCDLEIQLWSYTVHTYGCIAECA